VRQILALAAMAVTACTDEQAPRWSLDIDRIVAVRATPPHIATGDVARLTALLANADGTTAEAEPTRATAAFAPGGLFVAVHFDIDHWQIEGPDPAMLADARAELGLSDDSPVPLDVTLQFPGNRYATKTVWLGDRTDNPTLGAVAVDGALPSDDIPVTRGDTLSLLIEVAATDRVRWLTSCGTLEDDTASRARFAVDDPCTGELAVVVRDEGGGVAWRTFSVHVQ
jgi:hypothetical protein